MGNFYPDGLYDDKFGFDIQKCFILFQLLIVDTCNWEFGPIKQHHKCLSKNRL